MLREKVFAAATVMLRCSLLNEKPKADSPVRTLKYGEPSESFCSAKGKDTRIGKLDLAKAKKHYEVHYEQNRKDDIHYGLT